MAYMKLEQWKEAGQAFQEAVRLKPGDAEAHLGLCAYYLRMGDKEAAAREYQTLQSLDKQLAQKFADLLK
jgi:Flp pilus assembly protein TadD